MTKVRSDTLHVNGIDVGIWPVRIYGFPCKLYVVANLFRLSQLDIVVGNETGKEDGGQPKTRQNKEHKSMSEAQTRFNKIVSLYPT